MRLRRRKKKERKERKKNKRVEEMCHLFFFFLCGEKKNGEMCLITNRGNSFAECGPNGVCVCVCLCAKTEICYAIS